MIWAPGSPVSFFGSSRASSSNSRSPFIRILRIVAILIPFLRVLVMRVRVWFWFSFPNFFGFDIAGIHDRGGILLTDAGCERRHGEV